ncbi:MAG: hypothetical protein SNJ70_08745 [Armatimonadota bacterium]
MKIIEIAYKNAGIKDCYVDLLKKKIVTPCGDYEFDDEVKFYDGNTMNLSNLQYGKYEIHSLPEELPSNIKIENSNISEIAINEGFIFRGSNGRRYLMHRIPTHLFYDLDPIERAIFLEQIYKKH